jgi:hypothetical protein
MEKVYADYVLYFIWRTVRTFFWLSIHHADCHSTTMITFTDSKINGIAE